MKVLAITVGDVSTPSTKYRIAQFVEPLSRMGILVEVVPRVRLTPDVLRRVHQADVVVNQKCLMPAAMARRVLSAGAGLVFDFDDAIYTRPGRPYAWPTRWRIRYRLRRWLRASDGVTTSSEYLARYARRFATDVRVVPMALDTEVWAPSADPGAQDVVRVGWNGAPGSVRHLERIEPALASVLDRFPGIRLAVFCGVRPDLRIPFEYHAYRPADEVSFVRALHIGLLPLTNEDYSAGKSPIKAVQYMACGLPVVGEIRGAAAEVCTPENSFAVSTLEEWSAAIARLAADPVLARRMGAAARRHVVGLHDTQNNARLLGACLTDAEKRRVVRTGVRRSRTTSLPTR